MSTLTISVPDSLVESLEAAAKKEGVSVHQFVVTAAAEKLASEKTVDFLKERAAHGNRKAFEAYLKAVPDVPPMPGDEKKKCNGPIEAQGRREDFESFRNAVPHAPPIPSDELVDE